MTVETTHLEYELTLPAWERARAVLAGEDAIKRGGEKYLPKLDSQTDEEFSGYLGRASFFNATARTHDALLGLVFRADMAVKTPPELAEFVADADLNGTTFQEYTKAVVSEVLAVGRAGTLIDWADVPIGRAGLVLYRAEQILNWRTERLGGRNVLTLVVLRESVLGSAAGQVPDGGVDYLGEMVEQIRVLRLGDDEAVLVEVWQRFAAGMRAQAGASETGWVMVERSQPARRGVPLTVIPFVFHGPRNNFPTVGKLPLADIISLNLDHYRLDADYKHGLHYTALPTAWVSGFDAKGTLAIGSRVVWVAESKDAKAGFLEFSGQGLMAFERAQDRDERSMAVLGTRMLEQQKRAYESAATIELRQTAEHSVLGALTICTGYAMTSILRWVCWWNGTEPQPEKAGGDQVLVVLNSDFSPRTLAAQELLAVVSAWTAGAISRETLMDYLRAGEVLPPGRSNAEELGLVLAQEAARADAAKLAAAPVVAVGGLIGAD